MPNPHRRLWMWGARWPSMRARAAVRSIGAVCIALATACAGRQSPLAPSPMIHPDAITVGIGQTQVFVVENASAVGFTVRSDGGDWRRFVRIEAGDQSANAIRVVALERLPHGYVYVSANLGPGRSPLVAVMSVE